MIDARPQQFLGCSHPVDGTSKMRAQFLSILVHAVGQVTFVMCPDLLYRIQFRRVSRKPVYMNPFVSRQEFFNLLASVYLASVPNYDDLPSHVSQKIAKKRNYLVAGHIARMQADVQSQPALSGRYCQDTNNRHLLPSIAMPNNRGLSHRTPCPAHIRDQEEAGLIEKSQMGPKPFGLFLYAAKCTASSGEWHPRPVLKRADLASGNSTQVEHVRASRHLLRCVAFRSTVRSIEQFVVMSTNRWCVRRLRLLSIASSEDPFSAWHSIERDDPMNLGSADPYALCPDEPDTSVPRNSATRSPSVRHLETNTLVSPAQRLYDDVFLIVRGFLLVSSPNYSTYPFLVKDQ